MDKLLDAMNVAVSEDVSPKSLRYGLLNMDGLWALMKTECTVDNLLASLAGGVAGLGDRVPISLSNKPAVSMSEDAGYPAALDALAGSKFKTRYADSVT